MKKFRVLVGITRFEEIVVDSPSKDMVEFDKSIVSDNWNNEEIEILNIEELDKWKMI